MGKSIRAALVRLVDKGAIVACSLVGDGDRRAPGWVRPQDFELAASVFTVTTACRCWPEKNWWHGSI